MTSMKEVGNPTVMPWNFIALERPFQPIKCCSFPTLKSSSRGYVATSGLSQNGTTYTLTSKLTLTVWYRSPTTTIYCICKVRRKLRRNSTSTSFGKVVRDVTSVVRHGITLEMLLGSTVIDQLNSRVTRTKLHFSKVLRKPSQQLLVSI